jgi:hypothetical protein
VRLGAVWAQGAGPVRHGEGVLTLGAWLGVAGEKSGDKSVGLGGEGVSGNRPGDLMSQPPDSVPEEGGADRPRDLKCAGARVVIDTLVHQGAAWGAQVQGVAPDAALEATSAHGAPSRLQEGRRETARPKGREGADCVVADHDHRV